MKNWILGITLIAMTTPTFCNEVPPKPVTEDGRYVTGDPVALSMMGWGISLAVGIVTLVCLIPNHTSK